MAMRILTRLPVLLVFGLSACIGDSGDNERPSSAAPPPPDLSEFSTRELAAYLSMDGDAADGLGPVRPAEDPLVKLGQVLFFSRSLSGRFDVACASCHHPDFAGGDQLTLPIGVAAKAPEVVGLGRAIDADLDLSPDADGGPNVPRNSQTVINSALYDRALFHDGRVFVIDDAVVSEGSGQRIRTPESGTAEDANAGTTLLQAQARFPLVSNDEMRGFMYPELVTNNAYRSHLIERLRGNADQAYMSDTAAEAWKSLFSDAFGGWLNHEGEMISLARVTEALAAYQRSMTFTQTPWRQFLAGEDAAISDAARRGARLFLLPPEEGGLGCARCHSGDHFTNELFYNTGFPQIGRGKRPDDSDPGRADVNLLLQTPENQFAFRVPGLINVSANGPFGHAGTFSTLESVLIYHANPREQVDLFNFDLTHLAQGPSIGIPASELYPRAELLTRQAIDAESFSLAEALLPARLLNSEEVDDLVAFLETLTDPCVMTSGCLDDWIADPVDDPDGNLLVVGVPFSAGPPLPEPPHEAAIELQFPAVETRTSFADVSDCPADPSAVPNRGSRTFVRRDQALGLDGVHGFSAGTWLTQADGGQASLDEVLFAGGISASYIDDDCWPDLAFAGGDGDSASGLTLYLNQGQQNGFVAMPAPIPVLPQGVYSNVGFADLNGDYRREMVLGNIHRWPLRIFTPSDSGHFEQVAEVPMGRSTIGMAFGDVSGDGLPEMYLAHWSSSGLPGTAPAFWQNLDGTHIRAADSLAGTTEDVVTQSHNFAPGFVDLDGDADLDLTIASDFLTSVLLENTGGGLFADVTNRWVVNDLNGMGAALADYNNDGLIDWFVTSIERPELLLLDGNRLYINISSDAGIAVESSPLTDGVNDGAWGWGACAADFDNDGWQDIFHVNGYGKLPDEYRYGVLAPFLPLYLPFELVYANEPSRLFINQADGTFEDRAAAWGLDDVSEGRGVVCLDYDRDGDVDLGLVDHSVGIQFFENQVGTTTGNFLSVRVVGEAPNTDAIGARVVLRADVDGDQEADMMTRVVTANSNFASQNTTDLHFGVGGAEAVSLQVTWPGGDRPTIDCTGVPVNQFLVMDLRDGQSACPAP